MGCGSERLGGYNKKRAGLFEEDFQRLVWERVLLKLSVAKDLGDWVMYYLLYGSEDLNCKINGVEFERFDES